MYYASKCQIDVESHRDNVKYKYHHLRATMAYNPGQPRCFLGGCKFFSGRDTIKQTLNQPHEEKGINIIIYKQLTSTDRQHVNYFKLESLIKEHVMELDAHSKDLSPDLVCSDQLTFISKTPLQLYEWITSIFCTADDITK